MTQAGVLIYVWSLKTFLPSLWIMIKMEMCHILPHPLQVSHDSNTVKRNDESE